MTPTTATANDEGDNAAPASPETLLTKQETPVAGGGRDAEGQTQGDTPNDGANGQEEPVIPESPEGYKLTFDDTVNVNKGLLDNFQTTAHKLGFNTEQAQEVASLYVAHVQEQEKALQQRLTSTQKEWEAQIMDSPTFKTDVSNARKTLVQFGSFGQVDDKGNPVLHPELREIFDETMIGSHPKVFQMFAAIGKALSEPGIKGTTGTGTEASTAKTLYPNMN